MRLNTHQEYRQALLVEARKHLAKTEDLWEGPAEYTLSGYYDDRNCPVVYLRKIAPVRSRPDSGNRPAEAGKGEP